MIQLRFAFRLHRHLKSWQSAVVIRRSCNINAVSNNGHNYNPPEFNELTQPLCDVKELSLTENLAKYGVSVKQALQLDPKLEQRVAIAGKITYFKRNPESTVITVQDGRSSDQIYIHISNKTLDRLEQPLIVGSPFTASGLLFHNPKFDCNTLYCDLVLYHAPYERPMLPKSLDGVLDWPRSRLQMHLRTQTRKSAAVCRVRSHLIQHLHRVMANEQFCHVQTPCITSVDLDQKHAFEVIPAQNDTYFEVPVFLNQTAQLHLETVVSGIPRVYTINQAFTAHRHLSKLNAVENLNFDIVKTGSSFDEMLDSAENLCREVIEQVKQSEDSEFALILDQNDNPNFTKILHQNQPYFRMKYLEAIEVLNQKQQVIENGNSLSDYHCKLLSEYFEHYPIFVTHFPPRLQGFNVATKDDKKLAFELIFPSGIRIANGSIKEMNVDRLKQNLDSLHLKHCESSLQWYFESKSLGHVANYGFTMNLDRLLMSICRLPSVRDAVTFPRLRKYCPM